MMITLKYTCFQCGLYRVEVEAPARTTEDVNEWVENIAAWAVYQDHIKRSPFCISTKRDELMIPISGAEKLGGSVIQ